MYTVYHEFPTNNFDGFSHYFFDLICTTTQKAESYYGSRISPIYVGALLCYYFYADVAYTRYSEWEIKEVLAAFLLPSDDPELVDDTLRFVHRYMDSDGLYIACGYRPGTSSSKPKRNSFRLRRSLFRAICYMRSYVIGTSRFNMLSYRCKEDPKAESTHAHEIRLLLLVFLILFILREILT